MTTNKDPIFLNSVKSTNSQIDVAGTTVPVVVFVVGADGGALMRLNASSSDSADVILVLKIDDGATKRQLGEVTVLAGAGTNGSTPSKNVLDATAIPGIFQTDGSLALGPGAALEVNAKVTLGTGAVNLCAQGGNYGV